MGQLYQTVSLPSNEFINDPMTLPTEFIGLSDAVLCGLAASINPPPIGYEGKGLWPLIVSEPVLDPDTEIVLPDVDLSTRHADDATKTVLARHMKRPLTADELDTIRAASVPATISDRQFAQVLALDGVITQDEALAWAARGDLPGDLENALLDIPEDGGQRFGARMLLSSATTYERAHPLVPMLGMLLTNPATGGPYDAAALDSLWTRGAAL